MRDQHKEKEGCSVQSQWSNTASKFSTWSFQPVVHMSHTGDMQVTLTLDTSVGQVLPRRTHKPTCVCVHASMCACWVVLIQGATQPPQAETLTKQLIKHIAVFNTGIMFSCYNCHTLRLEGVKIIEEYSLRLVGIWQVSKPSSTHSEYKWLETFEQVIFCLSRAAFLTAAL